MWQLRTGQRFRFHQFDDEFVLYNDLSGDTHLLGDAAMHLLSVLQQGPHTHDSLIEALALGLNGARDGAFDAEAGAVIAQLAALHLIEATR
jgi:PqqD family protein of HPr-rel-A system